ATQHYVAGRWMARVCAGLEPSCANVLHHAVELFLKGALVGRRTIKELRDMLHRLEQLWDAYKATLPENVSLARFDATIEDLDRFWGIRYPDEIVQHGFSILLNAGRQATVWNDPAVRMPPLYRLEVAEVDDLVVEILRAIQVNRRYLTLGFSEAA